MKLMRIKRTDYRPDGAVMEVYDPILVRQDLLSIEGLLLLHDSILKITIHYEGGFTADYERSPQ